MTSSKFLAALSLALPLSLVCLGGGTAHAQADRPYVVGSQPQPMPNDPSFRDPKTGQVWTPDNVSQDGRPIDPNPEDHAFNPNGQVVNPGPMTDQHARIEHMGTVPITAGPTVPLVEIDNPTLRVTDGRRWHVVIYLQNNAGTTFAPRLGCHFFNGNKAVMNTRVLVPPTQGGERIGVSFLGPAANIYVDRVACEVESP
jgi:hypothetical protein